MIPHEVGYYLRILYKFIVIYDKFYVLFYIFILSKETYPLKNVAYLVFSIYDLRIKF